MGRGRHHDHALSGEWADYRDCHVKPDLVLVFTDGVRAMPCASEENGWPCRGRPRHDCESHCTYFVPGPRLLSVFRESGVSIFLKY